MVLKLVVGSTWPEQIRQAKRGTKDASIDKCANEESVDEENQVRHRETSPRRPAGSIRRSSSAVSFSSVSSKRESPHSPPLAAVIR